MFSLFSWLRYNQLTWRLGAAGLNLTHILKTDLNENFHEIRIDFNVKHVLEPLKRYFSGCKFFFLTLYLILLDVFLKHPAHPPPSPIPNSLRPWRYNSKYKYYCKFIRLYIPISLVPTFSTNTLPTILSEIIIFNNFF